MGWFRADVFGSRIAFTDRRGGVSRAPYDTLNLSAAAGDDSAAVTENRRRAGLLLGPEAAPDTWVSIRQVHGAGVVVCDQVPPPPPADTEAATDAATDADAVVVTVPGPTGVILTADCAPVALVGPGAVAGVHGGWKGLRAGVVAAAVEAFGTASGAPPALAVLGPCIRACCYEFGPDELATMVERFGDGVAGTTTGGRPALDVPAVVAAALAEAGVARVHDLGVCTACSPDCFSYRRDGDTGRQGLLVSRLPGAR